MNCKSKRLATLLSLVLMLSGCASTKLPLTEPVKVPPPPQELLAPLPPSPVNVEQLLLRWTNMLESWRREQERCRAMPQTCV